MQSLHKEIAFYELNDQCPTCSQKIDEGFKKSVIEKGKNKASEMNSAVGEIADQIDLTQKRLHEIDGIMRKIQDLNTLIMKKMSEIESTEKHIITMVNKKIPQTGNTEKDLHASIDLEQDTLDTKKELIEEQHYLSLAGTLLKDSGIKSRIIKNYIPVINETINKYLTQMNFFVNFNLNEEFNETIKSRHRDVFTYPSFSEGEKKKIDLALLFAWRAIASAKNSITTNLLILDEILDGSLDDQATDSFLDIMGTSKSGTNTFIISHKPKEVLQDKFDRCLQFVKRGNFSRIV
jgi:chromosome segregation ATPase